MEFKLGQKYRIVDIDAWWDTEMYAERYSEWSGGWFKNGDIVEVVKDYADRICFGIGKFTSQAISDLLGDTWHDSCIELIIDDITESDDTISLYHVADVLEDLIVDEGYEYKSYVSKQLRDKINLCIDSLRKAGY